MTHILKLTTGDDSKGLKGKGGRREERGKEGEKGESPLRVIICIITVRMNDLISRLLSSVPDGEDGRWTFLFRFIHFFLIFFLHFYTDSLGIKEIRNNVRKCDRESNDYDSEERGFYNNSSNYLIKGKLQTGGAATSSVDGILNNVILMQVEMQINMSY